MSLGSCVERCFQIFLKIILTPLKKKSQVEPDLFREDLLIILPTCIMRRLYYSQVQALLPVLLQGKILLCRTWETDFKDLGWDEPLAEDYTKDIVQFFMSLYEMEEVEF